MAPPLRSLRGRPRALRARLRLRAELAGAHFILGGGGTSLPCDVYGTDAVEAAIWSARRDASTGYGIAVFDLDPVVAPDQTSIMIRHFHAPGAGRTPTPDYQLFETVVLRKRRRG